MKLVVSIVVSFLICYQANGQAFKRYLKENAVSLTLSFTAGCFDGVNEVLEYDYAAFKSKFPKAHDGYWSTDSWKNKWKNGDPAQGAKFPGSTTIFVWTTDGYHLTKTLTKACITGAIVFHLGKKQKWYMYGVDFVTYSVMYSAGFNMTLHGIFKHQWK